MSETTKIAWCDSTVNFWSGCEKVSPGCANCFAEELSKRFQTFGQWGKGAPRKLHESAFKLAHRLNRKPWVCDECGAGWTLGQHASESVNEKQCSCVSPCHRRRIGLENLGDIFDPNVPIEVLARVLDTIRLCPDVDFLIVTKRPELFSHRLRLVLDWSWDNVENAPHTLLHTWVADWQARGRPPHNVWIIASAENQEWYERRRPHHEAIPAVVHGWSMEPLLGPIVLHPEDKSQWVIVGGESGTKARPCEISWIESIASQCTAADVPLFIKQDSGRRAGMQRRIPNDLWIRKGFPCVTR